MSMPIRHEVEFTDGRVSFLEWKSRDGSPTIVFAHANGFNANTYRSILGPLAENFRIVMPDMRGHGMTRLPTEPALVAGWGIYREDMLRFLDAVGGEKVLLAGHSLGASTMLMAAAAGAHNARALLLVEPVLPTNLLAASAMAARWLGRSDKLLPLVASAKRRRAWFPTREYALNGFRGRGGFKTWPNDTLILDYLDGGTVAADDGLRLTCAPEWEATNFSIFPFGLASLGRDLRVPTTVLYAASGSSAPPAMRSQLARGHGNARMVQVDGATHFLPMEKPDVVRAEIVALAKRAGLA